VSAGSVVGPRSRRVDLNERKTLRPTNGSSELIVAPGRGRVLQAIVNGTTAFWNSPGGHETWNVGGDRLWLAPEASWFWNIVDAPDFDHYVIPRALDPGRWKNLRLDPRSCEVGQRVQLRHQRSRASFAANVRRLFSIVELAPDDRRIDAIAYQTEDSLDLINGEVGQVVGLWSIVQLPIGGTVHIATSDRAHLRTCFGEIPDEVRRSSGRRIQVDLGGRTTFKVGLVPANVTGRWAYVRHVDDWFLSSPGASVRNPGASMRTHPLVNSTHRATRCSYTTTTGRTVRSRRLRPTVRG
jgi:hypothetical protein